MNKPEILTVAVAAAQEAGRYLVEKFGKISHIDKKGDRNFATDVDKGAERIIIERVRAAFPDHGILAEESGASGHEGDWLWIIDPLDGTHNFIRNINVFGVSIGVVHKNEFVAGVIYMPVDDELYAAETGGGASKNGAPIHVSKVNVFSECSSSFDSSIRYSPQVMLAALDALARQVFIIRMFGSSARHLSYVAEGKLDFSLEYHDRPWDFAGSVCIIREAGGMVTALSGKPISYKDIGYIASNGAVHTQLEAIVLAAHKATAAKKPLQE